mgnify:CR=1 FL=1
MATRGAKPKAAHLRLVDGTHRAARHGAKAAAKAAVETAATHFAALKKPTEIRGAAAKAWKKFIDPAVWLDGSREPAAVAFCELYGEFVTCPRVFPASKHGQMRAYMGELGLTDERNRGESDGGKEKDEFFGD